MQNVPGTRKIEPRKRPTAYKVDKTDDVETIQDKTEFNTVNEVSRYIQNQAKDTTRPNWAVPQPPKPGEVMHCQQCGKPMPPEGFSQNSFVRKREFKWHLHAACLEELDNLVDRRTPGLLAERSQKR